MRDKTALVFLKPQNPQSKCQIHAWQVLTGVPDTTKSFVYPHIQFDGNCYVVARPVGPCNMLMRTRPRCRAWRRSRPASVGRGDNACVPGHLLADVAGASRLPPATLR